VSAGRRKAQSEIAAPAALLTPREVVPVEQDFRHVIALAQKIRAKAPELRETSPAQLLRDTGRTPDIMGTM
jgi:hypothetical protein